MTLDEAMRRLAEVRTAIERHEAEVWCLERERDELRAQVRAMNHQASAGQARSSPGASHAA